VELVLCIHVGAAEPDDTIVCIDDVVVGDLATPKNNDWHVWRPKDFP